ncbi:aspartate-semialdehyde dehydrogenase [Marinicauda pacifica]|uniref:Aspartate-semialdehyde dehydrogenase n=1 Tax=Marinicauda pacifica TaxID=1133559 RepID=A0A4V3RZ00_9PROT|nr:aspartate-semialdehyde dehydrogenase [Marinicauda pacifica]TGY92359.1 aspartate-semialdehyde dehydrogenase [Marinicauda pacifica]GGE48238.1 aspartate-semialdehyde dehydrogenase [Marinicauda pacifica]
MGLKIAVYGATGAVGKEMLTILEERLFPAEEVFALATRKSIGRELSYGDRTLKVKDAATFDFSKVDLVLMSAGGDVSRAEAQKIAKAGAIVIDNSSAWRMDPDVPLIVPEVNADALESRPKKGIIANPNCSTIQTVVALKPIHDRARIKRVSCATYQAVSGGGQAAMDELWHQTRAIYVNDPIEPDALPKQIAFNVIPKIDVFMEDGATKEEWKMTVETKKILDPSIKLFSTCVRVPVFVGHCVAAHLELEEELSPEEARDILREAPGLMLIDRTDEDDPMYVTPIECVGEFATFVSRVRSDPTVENGLAMWIVSDNLRKGAALNAVQIAEVLLNKGILKA